MLSLEQLATLDLYLWLEREDEAARRLNLHQTSVSRQLRGALKTLNLKLDRSAPHKGLLGELELLQAERRVHQLARLRGLMPLRLDAAFSSGPWFAPGLPQGWISGNFDLPGKTRPLALLEERVIDAWIGSYQPDMPEPDDPLFFSVDLLHFPVYLTAALDHPLARERQISSGDLARFPQPGSSFGLVPQDRGQAQGPGALERHRSDSALRPRQLGGPQHRWGDDALRHLLLRHAPARQRPFGLGHAAQLRGHPGGAP